MGARPEALKWVSMALCTVGVAMASFNIYPAYLYILVAGTGGWCIAGVTTRDWPLALGEAVHLVLYIIGIFYLVIGT